MDARELNVLTGVEGGGLVVTVPGISRANWL